jgi:hypothetical protein
MFELSTLGTHCVEAGWAPGLVWTGAENFAAPGFDPRPSSPQPVAIASTRYPELHILKKERKS